MQSIQATLNEVLHWVNSQCRYVKEPRDEDTWLTYKELLAKGEGDCEDFAIAYWGLIYKRKLSKDIRLACIDISPPHMVCCYYAEGDKDPYVLDVLADKVYRLSDTDYRIIYELGIENGIATCWVDGEKAAASTPLKWRLLLHKIVD